MEDLKTTPENIEAKPPEVKPSKKDLYNDFSDNPYIYLVDGVITLTDEQKEGIITLWNSRRDNPPSLDEMIQHTFGRKYDPRAKPGVVIRQFLSERSIEYKGVAKINQERLAKLTELTDGQKEYIINNAKHMKAMKMACVLFENDKLAATSKEFVLVNEFIKNLDPKILSSSESEENTEPETGGYKPPKHFVQAAARINKYVYENVVKHEQWKTNSEIKAQLESLIKFCHHGRFVLIASKLEEKAERDLFEGSFIRYVWDKTDLTAEELDLYIDICQDVVTDNKIQDEITINTRLLEAAADEADGKKLSMSISEHIKNLRSEMGDNKDRRKKAIENLQGKRSERVDGRRKENDSLLGLVDFVKQKQGRERLAKTLEIKQKKLGDEQKRLGDLDDLIFEIYGVSQEEILYGKV